MFQEELQDDPENMQEMDILDMSILDETENDNGIPAEDDEDKPDNFHSEQDVLLNDDDYATFDPEDEAGGPEVRP